MGRKRNTKRFSSLMMAVMMCAQSVVAQARNLEFESVTSIDTDGYSIGMEAIQAELVVEEVYTSAGTSLEKGEAILKLTEESYQEALDYYEALLIRAQNSLTDAQLEYDKGVQAAEYTVELARAEAEQAQFQKAQSVKELDDTIAEHEEIMSELEEQIDELEDGISDGSYETYSGSSGGFSGVSGSTNNSGGMPSGKEEDRLEAETETETETETEAEIETETETETEAEIETETETETETEIETESESNPVPGPGQNPESDSDVGSESSPGTEDGKSETDQIEKKISELQEEAFSLQQQIETENKKYNSILISLYEVAGFSIDVFCGAGNEGVSGESGEAQIPGNTDVTTLPEGNGEAEAAPPVGENGEAEITPPAGENGETEMTPPARENGDTEVSSLPERDEAAGIAATVNASDNVKLSERLNETVETESAVKPGDESTGTENLTNAQNSKTEALQKASEAQTAAGDAAVQYQAAVQSYESVLSIIKNAMLLIENNKYAGYVDDARATADAIIAAYEASLTSYQNALSSYDTASSSYEESIHELQTLLLGYREKLLAYESELASIRETAPETEASPETEAPPETDALPEQDYSTILNQFYRLLGQLNGMESERKLLYEQYEKVCTDLEKAEQELESLRKEEVKPGDGSAPGTDGSMPGDGSAPGTDGSMPGDGSAPGTDGSMPGDGSAPGTDGNIPEDGFPGDMTVDGIEQNGAGQNGSGLSGGGFTMPSGGSFSMSSGSSSGGGMDLSGISGTGTSSDIYSLTGSFGGMNQGNAQTESLFGDTYDLTEVKTLLEREPTSTDAAEELVDQLEEWKETVTLQYEELIRIQKATQLDIQYTYDSTIIAGELAEITYQETMEELEQALAEAQEELADVQEIQVKLKEMADGIVTATEGGLVAAVNYEAEDRFDASAEILSFYDTSKVYVSIEVSQYDIHLISVGDTVEVDLGRSGVLEGSVTEKVLEAAEGKSRTDVVYDVKITLDNEDGRLSSGTSATVKINSAEEERISTEMQEER